MSDFVVIMHDLSNFIQNERTSSYNEGVDMMLANVREWMRLQGITPKAKTDLPELLDEIAAHVRDAVGGA
jgi:hypothetical protein